MKYSTFKYGGGAAGAEYGTGVAIEQLTWSFSVFWDDAFVDEASQSEMIDLSTSRGRDHLLSGSGSAAWEHFKAGEAVGTFYNETGRYDAYNSSGPLYGFLLPGRVVRVAVDVLPPYADTPTTYEVLRGIIDDIQTFTDGGTRKARISVRDGLEWLNRRSITLGLVEAAEALVTAAAIATSVGFDGVDDWTIVQLGTDSVAVPYAFGNINSALSLINEFTDAEAGQVFHAKDGVLTFVTNDYTQTDTTDIDQTEILKDIQLRQPWEVVRTRAQIVANPMIEGAPAILWSFGNEGVVATWTAVDVTEFPTSPYLYGDILPGVSDVEIDALFSDPGTASTGETVSWEAVKADPTPLTNNWVDASTETLVITDIGNGYHLAWDFSTGGGQFEYVVITWAEITASPIETGDIAIATASDATTIAIYGEKTFELDNLWIQDFAYAQAYANYIVAQLKNAKLFPTIIVENRAALQFGPELYVSKIHLTVAALGIDDTFRVGKIEHRWLNENGFATQTILKLEPVLGVLE